MKFRILIVIIAVLIAGSLSYEDEVNEAQHCAKMVKEGVWPPEVCSE